jgi:rare lipoprotein A
MKLRFAFLSPLTAAILGTAILLTGCAETRLVLHTAKKLSNKPETPTGTYKVGKPYQIRGVWYHPHVNYGYRETGIASWYGAKFHNRQTANGQIFDMNSISAAHRTLPLPSVVQVTNLSNGRSLKILVNDRGPFAHGRIIDLSRRAAQLLGFERAGTARVLVEIVADESRRLAQLAQGKSGKPVRVSAITKPMVVVPITPVQKIQGLSLPVPGKGSLFVQAGAFVRKDLAKQMERDLAPIGPTRIVEATIGERLYYRVRLGPVAMDESNKILDAVVRTGYPDARLVTH